MANKKRPGQRPRPQGAGGQGSGPRPGAASSGAPAGDQTGDAQPGAAPQGSAARARAAQTGAKPAGSGSRPSGARPGANPPRIPVQYGPKNSSIRRTSVASSRPTKSNNRTQLIIAVTAILVIGAVVITGVLLNRANAVIPDDGYGKPKTAVASIDNGAIVVTGNGGGATLDVYEDMICPACAEFEKRYEQQIAKAIDERGLTVRYHFLTFLDQTSGSKNYSSRAAAALMCTADKLGSTKAVWTNLHSTLMSPGVQPTEGAAADLTDNDLNTRIIAAATDAGLAGNAPAVLAATACVTNGEMKAAVVSGYDASKATLTPLVGGVASPVVVRNGAVVNINETEWLSDILG
jgi:protein-disulfide isomerase